jgi:hypothetical protein
MWMRWQTAPFRSRRTGKRQQQQPAPCRRAQQQLRQQQQHQAAVVVVMGAAVRRSVCSSCTSSFRHWSSSWPPPLPLVLRLPRLATHSNSSCQAASGDGRMRRLLPLPTPMSAAGASCRTPQQPRILQRRLQRHQQQT